LGISPTSVYGLLINPIGFEVNIEGSLHSHIITDAICTSSRGCPVKALRGRVL
jgi:hypothetical protein